jgi:hypothetical protein
MATQSITQSPDGVLAPPVETGDTCREFSPDAEPISGIDDADGGAEIKASYEKLNRKIIRSADKYGVKAQDAAASWDILMPLIDRMQAMLSQRGEQRELMDTLGLPSWTEWFKEFRPRLKEVTLRTIQRKIAEYRGKKPVKRDTRQKYDAVDIAHLEKVALTAQQLAEDDIDNPAYNPIREAIASKPDGGLAAVEGHQIKTPVHTQINQLALQLANSVLSFNGVPESCAMLAQQIVDLMTPAKKSEPPEPTA